MTFSNKKTAEESVNEQLEAIAAALLNLRQPLVVKPWWESKITMLETAADITWLFDTRLRELERAKVKCALIYGHEDCPMRVVLYDVDQPDVDSVPICTITFPE